MSRSGDSLNSETGQQAKRIRPSSFLPFLRWFRGYNASRLRLDFVSGLTVALVLIPQSMAYAQLADLPAYYGLYAAFLPPVIAALWGSSNQLATGPVAIVSLMTATALSPLATAGSESFVAYAILLALTVGVFQFLLGALRLGMVVNFLSHPVVNGFTNAAALIIATSQLSKLFGVDIDKAEHHYETVYRVIEAALHHTHWPTLGLAALAFAIMIVLRRVDRRIPNVLVAVVVTTLISWTTGFERNRVVDLNQVEVPEFTEQVHRYNQTLDAVDSLMTERIKAGELARQVTETLGQHSMEAIELHAQTAKLDAQVRSYRERASEIRCELREFRFTEGDDRQQALSYSLINGKPAEGHNKLRLKVGNRGLDPEHLVLMAGGAVVGEIPRGLPEIRAPKVEWRVMLSLFPMAIVISLLGFMEAISIAKAMAARTGQRLDANQELIGQGLGNILGAFGQSYPVSGSFSRSAVNLQAGAVTGLSNVFSSLVVMATLLFFTPMLYHLPQSVLAAIIMMAVIGLVNVSGFVHAWKAQPYDGTISVITFVLTLLFAPHLDRGILIGVVLSLALYLLRNMKPRFAELSRTVDGHYRNADRWGLKTCRHVGVIRFNNSLIFANVNYLEDKILTLIGQKKKLRHILIVGNGMNELDASGEVFLSKLTSQLRERDIDLSFSGLNDAVIDVMKRTHLYEKIGEDHFYLSVGQAIESIHQGTCLEVPSVECPLLISPFTRLEVDIDAVDSVQRRQRWVEKTEAEKKRQPGSSVSRKKGEVD